MKWKLALAQHPMYLLIREDTHCAERTPPWGAPTIEAYIERVRQNLDALERYPWLKLGYEWSGVELELLAMDSPEVFQKLRGYTQAGRVCFYNGTYAQPHLQTLSSESNLRQFQFGREVYQELGLNPVMVYAHQEASVHDQVPQLLCAFGIPFAVVPDFLTTLVNLEPGELLLHGARGPRFIQGSEFAGWLGLDGTKVPLYLHQPISRELPLRETLAREVVLARLAAPPLMIEMPDMTVIDDDWIKKRKALEFVTLEQALSDRLDKNPVGPNVRLYTNWSYLEGIRAEQLSRCNLQAEREALRAEALNSLAWVLGFSEPASTHAIWKTILKSQHHDVYCFSAPELREKAIGWLTETDKQASMITQQAADAIVSHIQTDVVLGQPVVVFSTVPHAMSGLVEIASGLSNPQVFDAQGTPLPCEVAAAIDCGTLVRFAVRTNGLGYSTYWLRNRNETAIPQEIQQAFEYQNPYYRVVFQPDGTFSSLQPLPSSAELIAGSRTGGNFLSATDSASISFKAETVEERIDRYLEDPEFRGPQLAWQVTTPASVTHSSLGVTIKVSGRMGEHIQADLTIRCYHHLPRIDITYQFRFNKASVGTFFDDDSKLLVSWPLALAGKIQHDIPFGVIEEKEDRPFFPVSWVDYSDGENGIAFFHQGTPNHWVHAQTVFNLLAWGEDTDAIHNGLGRYQWLKSFDQRLDGLHTIHLAVLPHHGDWRAAGLPRAAQEYGMPLIATNVEPHPGELPSTLTLFQLPDPACIATSVQIQAEQLVCRLYSTGETSASPQNLSKSLRAVGMRLIQGVPVKALNPYQIGELIFEKTH